MKTIIETLRKLRKKSRPLEYEKTRLLALDRLENRIRALALLFSLTFIGVSFWYFRLVRIPFSHFKSFMHALWECMALGILYGFSAVILVVVCMPVILFAGHLIVRRKIPSYSWFQQFSTVRMFLAFLGFSLLLSFIFQDWMTHTLFLNMFAILIHHSTTPIAWANLLLWSGRIVCVALILYSILRYIYQTYDENSENLVNQEPFGLWVGTSTGALSDKKHKTGMAAKQSVVLTLKDACQNILILGGIGAGKTKHAITPLLIQLLDQDCGGLIFDIKGDFNRTVERYANQTESKVVTIGVNHQKINLIADLTPEIAATFLKSTLLLNNGSKQDKFWVNAATSLTKNVLGMLQYLPNHYTLQGLYRFIFENKFREEIQRQLKELLNTTDHQNKRLITHYIQQYDTIFSQYSEKVKSDILATVSEVLSDFNHPSLADAFCYTDTQNQDINGDSKQSQNEATETDNEMDKKEGSVLNIKDVMNGVIYLVDMPLSEWGFSGKLVYTFIKLIFFNVMQQRANQEDWDQDRPIFFMCDEYQEIVSGSREGVSDLNFWDKSRSTKTIGIVSAQSISSFYASIGDKSIADTLLQNFRQKICFRTEDATTIDAFSKLAGRVEVERKSHSRNTGKSHHKINASTHRSKTTTSSWVEKNVIDSQLFRILKNDQAIALLSWKNNSMDDILTMFQY